MMVKEMGDEKQSFDNPGRVQEDSVSQCRAQWNRRTKNPERPLLLDILGVRHSDFDASYR